MIANYLLVKIFPVHLYIDKCSITYCYLMYYNPYLNFDLTEGVFHITVSAFNEFYNSTNELGAYFVQMVPEGLVLNMNSSVIHKNEIILFSAKLTRGTAVTYSWNMGDQTSYVDEGKNVFGCDA